MNVYPIITDLIYQSYVFSKPSKDILSEYSKRAAFLKGVVQTATLSTPIEKVKFTCFNLKRPPEISILFYFPIFSFCFLFVM